MRLLHRVGFKTGSFVMALGAVTGFVLTSLASLYVVRALSKTDYGMMTYFSSWFSPALLLLGLGLSTSVTTEIARRLPDGSPPELARRIVSLLVLRLITLVPLALLGVALVSLTGQPAYALVALAAAFAILGDFLLGILKGYGRVNTVAALSIVQPLAYTGLLLAGLARTINGVFSALGLSYICSVIFVVIILFYWQVVTWQLPSLAFWQRYLREIFGFSVQVQLIGMFQVGFGSYLLILLGLLARYDLVAEISVPLTLIYLPVFLMGSIWTTVFYPRLVSSRASAGQTFDSAYCFLAAVSLPGMAVAAVYADVVISMLYTSRYINTTPLLVITAPLIFILAAESLMTLTQIGLGRGWEALGLQVGRLMFLGLGSAGILAMRPQGSMLAVWWAGLYLLAGVAGFCIQAYYVRKMIQISFRPGSLLLVGAGALGLALVIRELTPFSGLLWLDVLKAGVSVLLGIGLGLGIYFGPTTRWPVFLKRLGGRSAGVSVEDELKR